MQRITISISDATRAKLKHLAGERSESEYARELLEVAMRQEEMIRMAAELRNLPEAARTRDRAIERAMAKLRGF
jgi:predicted CopG family antitoxin